MPSTERKKFLLMSCQGILTNLTPFEQDLNSIIKGNQSLAQEISNRCEQICKDHSPAGQIQDEFNYLVDAISKLILMSKGKEMQIYYNGKVLSKEDLAKDFGIFLTPKK